MKNNRVRRLFVGIGGVLVVYMMVIELISIMPTIKVVEDFQGLPTVFVGLAEKNLVTGKFEALNSELKRVDILFKNPNLESRDELLVRIYGEDDKLIVDKILTGFNLGDTTQARVDLPSMGKIKSKEKIVVEVLSTKIIDGKLMVGTRNGDLNLRQYYGSGGKLAGDNVMMFWNKIWQNKIVILLPFIFLTLALW